MKQLRKTRVGSVVFIIALGVFPLAMTAAAAETADASFAQSKTLVVLRLGSNKVPKVRTSFREPPPTVRITFPGQRIAASLPEQSSIAQGVIKSVTTRYYPRRRSGSRRLIKSIDVALRAPYAYELRSEPGRVVLAINHPASISGATMEVAASGASVIDSFGAPNVSERFRAIQAALADATPAPWQLTVTPKEGSIAISTQEGAIEQPVAVGQAAINEAERPGTTAGATTTHNAPAWIIALLAAIAGIWWLTRKRIASWPLFGRAKKAQEIFRSPSSVTLIDQLVWQAFERQGYRLLEAREIEQPCGTFRIISKNGARSGLMCISNGIFFEKRTVERFAAAMHEMGISEGFLGVLGSFTVPAQRFAKQHRVTLLGREELIELLSLGATSERMEKELKESRAQLEEAKESMRRYAGELEILRRQRNEASWALGEERARSGKLQKQLSKADGALKRFESELTRWEQEASALRKKWEESQWYLGESHSRVGYLEQQLLAMQDALAESEGAKGYRQEAAEQDVTANGKLQELETEIATLRAALDEALSHENELQDILERCQNELRALHAYGERRGLVRARPPNATVEVLDEAGEAPVFSGAPCDLSPRGLGLKTERAISPLSKLRVRLKLPGMEKPIRTKAQLAWQQPAKGLSGGFRSGYRLHISAAKRTFVEDFLEQHS